MLIVRENTGAFIKGEKLRILFEEDNQYYAKALTKSQAGTFFEGYISKSKVRELI